MVRAGDQHLPEMTNLHPHAADYPPPWFPLDTIHGPNKSTAQPPADATTQKILTTLNGTGRNNGSVGGAAMNVPPETRQLVVVTSTSWTDTHGELRIFEREPGKPWHAVDMSSGQANPGSDKSKWIVNVGRNGMGWGVGGLITTPAVQEGGQTENTGGPTFSTGADGKTVVTVEGNAKVEGDGKLTAGLFRIGFGWGSGDAPVGTTIPFKSIDPTPYRIVDDGKVVRNLDPKAGTWERYANGKFITEHPPHDQFARALNDNKYRWVHQNVMGDPPHALTDEQGRDLKDMLVRVDGQVPVKNKLPDFTTDAHTHYDAFNPKTGQFILGTLSQDALKAVLRESDYRWADDTKYVGKDEHGNPDKLYNEPIRIVNEAGEYEKLDRNTGKVVGRGTLDPETLQSLENDAEVMSHELYGSAIVVEQNTAGQPKGGSAIFIHVQRGPDQSTAGCISMPAAEMEWLDRKLDPLNKHTLLLALPLDQLPAASEALRLQKHI